MASAVLTPDSTVTNNGATVTGAASVHAALADGADSSYVVINAGDSITVSLANLSLPAGAVIQSLVGVARDSHFGNATTYFDVYAGVHYNRQIVNVTWLAATTHYTNVYSSPTITDADADAAQLYVGVTTGNLYLYTLNLVVLYVTQPTCNITAPAGTVTNNTSPTVTWTTSLDSQGGAATHFAVEILDSDSDVVVESGTVLQTSALSWDFPEALPEGTYTCRVRVAQTVNSQLHWSAWDSQAFTIDALLPGAPTMTLTPDSDNARIRIDLSDSGGETDADFFHLERSDDGGVTWNVVRSDSVAGLITPDGSGDATLYDYDAPNGVTVQYRAHASHWFNFGTPDFTTTSSGYTKDSDIWTSEVWWLKHPTRPSLNYHPVLRSQPGRTNTATQGVFHPLGRRSPVVVADVRQGWSGEVVLRCADDNDREYLDAILADGLPLLLQGPVNAYWDDTWISVSSLDRQRAIDQEWGSYTFDTLTWVEVDPPVLALEE